MLSKEEIKEMKDYFNECLKKDIVYEEDLTLSFIKVAQEYIQQLESEKQIKINGKKSDISAFLLNAERYALGRQTYIVNWTCEFIGNNKHLLRESDKIVMIRDIKQCEHYGWDCDKEEWMNLLKILEGEDSKC